MHSDITSRFNSRCTAHDSRYTVYVTSTVLQGVCVCVDIYVKVRALSLFFKEIKEKNKKFNEKFIFPIITLVIQP